MSVEIVGAGMSGVFVERNVEVPDYRELVDIIKVPGWKLEYQTDAGLFNHAQIQQAVSMYGHGVQIGIELGRKQAQAEIRKTLGIEP